MNSVRFSVGPWRQWISVLIRLPLIPIAAFNTYYSIADLQSVPSSLGELGPDELGGFMIWLTVAKAVLAVIVLLLVHYIAIRVYRLSGPERNFLQLDQDGFRYTQAGKSRHWPWSALPAFKTIPKYRQIRFVLPKGDAKSKRRDRWIHEVTPDGPVVAIRDFYDTPFDEIAAKLNEYRERALGGERATAGQ